jgi:hypothetical protein
MPPPERPEREEATMSDPRFTNSEPRIREEARIDPTVDPIERERTGGAVWGWVAGIAVLVLIAFVLIGGWGSGGNTNTASNTRPVATSTAPTGSAPAAPAAPATTGAAPAR